MFNPFIYLEKIGKGCGNVATFILLYILNPGHRYAEVKSDSMILSETVEGTASGNADSARTYYEEEVKRSKVVDEKNKVLLTIAALLVAACSAIAAGIEPKWLILVPLIPTVVSIFLILVHFGVQTVSIPKYELTNDEQLAESYYHCKENLSRATEFRVGIYRAACRSVTMGVILLAAIFIYFASVESLSTEDKLIKAVHNNAESLDRLRGPQWPAGPKGEHGLEGAQWLPGKVFINPQTQLNVNEIK
ncbi:MAG: hypothetical protein KAI59_01455 [Planctomycetes bacterium]|nr:hypothetical protein [Planctomycetota bacterium]